MTIKRYVGDESVLADADSPAGAHGSLLKRSGLMNELVITTVTLLNVKC